MSLGYLEIFEIVADCSQVLLCVVLVAMLIRHRRGALTPEKAHWPSEATGPFRHEFMRQSLRHQCELSFDNIQKAIEAERVNLQRLHDLGAAHLDPDTHPADTEEISVASFQMASCESVEDDDSPGGRYRQVTQLAADGLKAPRIAKQLGIPRGEVDLVLKLDAAGGSENRGGESAVGQMRPRG